jgi:hypothetical protein
MLLVSGNIPIVLDIIYARFYQRNLLGINGQLSEVDKKLSTLPYYPYMKIEVITLR